MVARIAVNLWFDFEQSQFERRAGGVERAEGMKRKGSIQTSRCREIFGL